MMTDMWVQSPGLLSLGPSETSLDSSHPRVSCRVSRGHFLGRPPLCSAPRGLHPRQVITWIPAASVQFRSMEHRPGYGPGCPWSFQGGCWEHSALESCSPAPLWEGPASPMDGISQRVLGGVIFLGG